MIDLRILSPLADFANLISSYFREIWDFLIFIGSASAVICILIGTIMFGVGVKVNKTTGRNLIFGGIVLAIIIQFLIFFPPEFTLG